MTFAVTKACSINIRSNKFLSQNSMLIVDKLEFETNPAIGNLSFVFKDHQTYGQVVDVTVQSFVTATSGLVYVSINFPDDENDQKYQKQFLRASFDVQKVLKGIYSNPIAKNFVHNLNDSIDFELKLPFKPVREKRILRRFIDVYEFQRVYRLSNFHMSDAFIPIFTTTKGKVDVRVVGKVAGNSSNLFFGHLVFYGRLIR